MAGEMVLKKNKILFLITEDWFFCSHRLSLACAARDAGYEVVVATRVQKHSEIIRKEGFKLIPLRLDRGNKNIFKEIPFLVEIINLYKRESPDIVHHVAMKPILYGSIASYIVSVPMVVNALTGMGYVFTSLDLKARVLQWFVKYAFRILFDRENFKVIVQNPEDLKLLTDSRVAKPENVVLIKGSGVDVRRFSPKPEPDGVVVVLLAARMLWDKGVGEFIMASRYLKNVGVIARFVLVGGTDPDNPSSIDVAKINEWNESGLIEWWGHSDDMPSIFAKCHIVCLPSYREGLPKVLIEAAACGRPIVATDVPGCREVVRDKENGILVPVHDAEALARAIRYLVENPVIRSNMGLKSREIAIAEFSIEKIKIETISLYSKLQEGVKCG